MMNLAWNLTFNGNCETAFKFYEKVLGGKITVKMTWGESPMAKDMPAEWGSKITHMSMDIKGAQLTGGDAPGEHYEKPQGFHIILNLNDVAEAERLFNTLSEGGEVEMKLEETFWAKRFAMVIDRFGTPWMINCGKQQ